MCTTSAIVYSFLAMKPTNIKIADRNAGDAICHLVSAYHRVVV